MKRSLEGEGGAGFEPRPVLPGEDVTAEVVGTKVRLGAGLHHDGAAVRVCVSGRLSHKAPNKYWVESSTTRYAAAVGDTVIGIVTDRMSDAYRLDIHGTSSAVLPSLAFEGASKRNKPNLAVGTLVFARVAAADKDLDAELSCQVSGGPKKDWVTGECVFGELKNGNVFDCSMRLARRLLSPECEVLRALGSTLAFEVAVGCNGRVWVNSAKVKHTILISNAILASERCGTDDETRRMVKGVLQRFAED